jgi:PAS domain S-box-containing protein
MTEISSTLTSSNDLAGLRAQADRALDAADLAAAQHQNVVLVLTELATNALMHAPGPYRASLVVENDCAIVLISDGGGERLVAMRDSLGGEGGFGLRVTDSLAQSWGCIAGAVGKTVWAVIPRVADRSTAGGGPDHDELRIELAAVRSELEQSRSQFESAQQLAHLGTFQFDIASGELSFSDELYRICGLDPETQRITTLEEVIPLLDGGGADRIPDLVVRAAMSRSPIQEVFTFVRPDGEQRLAELLIETVADEHGQRLWLRGTALDITVQRRNETELLAHRRALEEAQRLARLGSWHYDLIDGSALWSPQMFALFGIDPAEGPLPIGQWQQRVHPEDGQLVSEARRQALRNRRAFSYEARMAGGGQGWVAAVHGEPVLDAAGAVVAVHGTVQDITDRWMAERALIASEAAGAAEHAAIEALQRSVLPASLPELEELELAARYEPAGHGTLFGGDWYDAYAVPDGRVVIALGDVAGHGLDAVAITAQLRNAARAYSIQSPSPAATLAALDQLVHQLYPNEMATMILGIYDPIEITITLARAGHPHPVVHTPGTPAALLEVAGGLPLGAGHAASIPYVDTIVPLSGPMRLVFYSDGCIEQRGRSLADGVDTLVREVGASTDLDDLCDRVVGLQTAGEDDRCVLALHRRASPTQL